MNKKPKTVEEILALPEGSACTQRTITIDTPELAAEYGRKLGDTVHIPIACKASVVLVEEDDFMFVRDSEGFPWRLAIYDNEWYRERVFLP